MVFFKYMMDWDTDKSHFGNIRTYAVNMTSAVGKLLDTNKTAIYNAYWEWKEGGRVVDNDEGPQRHDAFRHPTQGTYAQWFLLD